MVAALVVLAAACGGGGGGDQSAPATTSPPSTVAAAVTTSSPTTTTEKPIDAAALLAKEPMGMFSAFPPRPEGDSEDIPAGQRDWDELWKPDSPWQNALEHVDVYRLHAFQVRRFLSDEQLVTLFAFLREHDIALMFETEPLLPVNPAECAHSESFAGPYDVEMAQRIADLGGHIDMIAVEEPYHFGHLLDTPRSCQYPVERVVKETHQQVMAIRDIFGDIPAGSIEPIWVSPATSPDNMAEWLDTYKAQTGEPLAFLYVDPDWNRSEIADVAAGIEAVADARGVPFGILYIGSDEPDGAAWMQAVAEHATELEQVRGVTPQHVSFQSWVAWPDHDLPETDLSALTSGIVRYFGHRDELGLEAVDGRAVATLLDDTGAPVAGAPLEVTVEPTGRGVSTQTISGTVPDGASEVVVLVRANAEGTVVGDVDVTLRDITLRVGDGPNLIANGDFSRGTQGWAIHGDPLGSARVVTDGAGSGLEMHATPEQNVFVEGPSLDLAPGDPYEFSATYEVDKGSADTVVIAVEFVDIARVNISAHPVAAPAGVFTTDANGRAELADIGTGIVTAHYLGDLDYWPAKATLTLG